MCSYCPDPTPEEVRDAIASGRTSPADVTAGRPDARRPSGIEIPCPNAPITNVIEGNRINTVPR